LPVNQGSALMPKYRPEGDTIAGLDWAKRYGIG
jgi:hypothetical protein